MNFAFIAINPKDVFVIFPFALNLRNGYGSQLLPLIQDPLRRKSRGVLLHQSAAVFVDLLDLVADDRPHSDGRLLEHGLARGSADELVRHGRPLESVVVILNGERRR